MFTTNYESTTQNGIETQLGQLNVHLIVKLFQQQAKR